DRDRGDRPEERPRRPPPSGGGEHPVPHCPAHPSGPTRSPRDGSAHNPVRRRRGRRESSGQSTNYDLTARTDLDNGLYTGSSGPRIIILGNCGYFRTDPRACNPRDARSLRRRYDALMWTAAEVRWVSSPYNVFTLLRNSPSLSRSTDAGTVTYRGTAPGGRLAAGGPTAPFYQEFGNDLTKVTYTLVTSRDHLPERLDIDLWTSVQPGLT